MNAVATTQSKALTLEQVLIGGDLSKLDAAQRIEYHNKVCESSGLNPLTQPFSYLNLNGKLVLYANRSCTDQLRVVHGVSVVESTESERDGVFIVTVKVQNKDGRTDIAKGAVKIEGLKGDALANAIMKAETKAKRRATLSICGLSLLDETEIETIPNAQRLTPPPAPKVVESRPLTESEERKLDRESMREMRHETPDHDPETGEVGPRALTLPKDPRGRPNWIAWGGQLITAFQSACSESELSKWLQANDDTLTTCETYGPKVYGSVTGAYQKRYQELTGKEAHVA